MKLRSLLVIAACALGALTAPAAPIVYTMSGVATGVVGETTFTDQDYNFQVFGDTANVTGTTFLSAPAQSASITIGNLGTFTFTNGIIVFRNNDVVGFEDPIHFDLIDTTLDVGSGVESYDLASNFGPFTGSSNFALYQFVNVATSGGLMTINSMDNPTFRSTTETSVPDATSSAGLLGLGLVALAALKRRKG